MSTDTNQPLDSNNVQDNFQSILTQLQQSTTDDLMQIIEYLHAENRVYRSKFKHRVPLNDSDRKSLVEYGIGAFNLIKNLMTLVKPETLLAWHRKLKALKHTFPHKNEKPGRPPYDQETVELIIKLAKENCWGYDRIKNEMTKLGYHVSDSYVKCVLRENGLPIQPIRRNLDWRKFLKAHMHQIWATDFFTEEVWTLRGLVTYYVLFFIHLETRQLFFAGATPHPNAQWTRKMTRNFPELHHSIFNIRYSSFAVLSERISNIQCRISKAEVLPLTAH